MTVTPDTLLDSAAVAESLSTRAFNVLNCSKATRGTHTVRDLAAWRMSDLLQLRGCGVGVLQELTELIHQAGLEWGTPPAEQPKSAPPEPKPALPKVVQLASVGDEMLTALLDDGTIWWKGSLTGDWKPMPPPRPCIAPDNHPA